MRDAGFEFELTLEDEIRKRRLVKNGNALLERRIVRFADDGPVLDAPDLGIVLPAVEGFPVEERDSAAGESLWAGRGTQTTDLDLAKSNGPLTPRLQRDGTRGRAADGHRCIRGFFSVDVHGQPTSFEAKPQFEPLVVRDELFFDSRQPVDASRHRDLFPLIAELRLVTGLPSPAENCTRMDAGVPADGQLALHADLEIAKVLADRDQTGFPRPADDFSILDRPNLPSLNSPPGQSFPVEQRDPAALVGRN